MRVFLALAGALALGGVAAPASAADWRLASAGRSGAVFVDADSIRRSGKEVTFTLWAIYRERAASGVDNAKARRRANCDDYSFTDLERTFLYVRKVLSRSGQQPEDSASQGSLNHWSIRYACAAPGEGRRSENYPDPYLAARAKSFWRE